MDGFTKLNYSMACNIVPPPCMDGEMGSLNIESLGSQTLQSLAKQLQYYKPPCLNEEVENSTVHGIGGTTDFVAVKSDLLSCVNCKERRAAVLICLFQGDEGELRVILTKRSMNLSSYPGEVALPGGKMEEGDADDSATALREAMEEIGLDPGLVQVVANLEPFLSERLLSVVPVVSLLAKIGDFIPLLNPDEVDAIFDVPLEMFLKEENHRIDEREWMGWNYVLHLFDFESEQGVFLIWGLTASILIRAASVVYQRSPCFTHHLPDFQQLQRALNGSGVSHLSTEGWKI